RYEDIFIPNDTENELNNPGINLINITTDWEALPGWVFWDKVMYRAIRATLVIDDDVVSGNEFKFVLYDSKKNPRYTHSVKAGLTDTSKTIATKFANKFRESIMNTPDDFPGFEFVDEVDVDGAGNAFFEFKFWNAKDAPYLSYS